MPSHREVAHNWAHQTGKACRGANMFYEGTTIYSWGHHWPIATIYERPAPSNGVDRVVLFTDERRSVSTSTHTRIVMQACNHMLRIRVPDPGTSPGRNAQRIVGLLAAKWARLDEMRAANSRAYRQILDLANAAYDYAFDLTILGTYFPVDDELKELAAIERDHADTLAWVNAHRTADAHRRAARDAKQAANERKAALAARPKTKAKLRKWLAGGDTFPIMKRIWCRVKGDRLETSQGASVPLAIAKRVFVLAENARSTNRSWSDPNYHVGQYKGLGITHLGTIVVGCHRIPFHTARIAARQAGID